MSESARLELRERGAYSRESTARLDKTRAVAMDSRRRTTSIGFCCVTGSMKLATRSGRPRELDRVRSRDLSIPAVGCERPGGGRALIRLSLTLGIGSFCRSVRQPPRGAVLEPARRGPNAAQPELNRQQITTYGSKSGLASEPCNKATGLPRMSAIVKFHLPKRRLMG